MRKLALIVITVLSLTGTVVANIYEDDRFLIGVFQGWEHLPREEGRLVFKHSAPSQYSSVYDFVLDQFKAVEKWGTNVFSVDQLCKEFGERLFPVVIMIQAKTPVPNGQVKIEHIYTENYSFETSQLRGWEYEYKHLPLEYWATYYTIHIPESHLYKTVFLLPNIAEETVTVTIADYYGYRQSVPSVRLITAKDAKAIVLLSQSFNERLESFIQWWQDSHGKPPTIDVTVTETSWPDGVSRWMVSVNNLDGDPNVRSQVQVGSYLVDKIPGEVFVFRHEERILIQVD